MDYSRIPDLLVLSKQAAWLGQQWKSQGASAVALTASQQAAC
jgi:hypothetical protein